MGRILAKPLRCTSLLLASAALVASCSNGDAQRVEASETPNAPHEQLDPAVQARQANEERAAEVSAALAGLEETPVLTIYKTPTCGCCQGWVDHVEEAGFAVEVHDVSQQELTLRKFEHDLEHDLHSCHTAVADGYLIEGHVPADAIARLLRERPEIAGIAVPGMPLGSPGMEAHRIDPYDVIGYDREGGRSVFATY